MNNGRFSENDQHRALQNLDELTLNDSLTQRDLSSRLGIALGLVNSYIKNLIGKGYITVKSIHPRRYAYFLTPKGFAEKTRLTYNLLHDYTRIYREARSGLKELFSGLRTSGVLRITFAGADEVAEIAYITLQEMELELSGVVDDDLVGKTFFGREVGPISSISEMEYDCIVVTSYLKREKILGELLRYKADRNDIKVPFVIKREK
jgi:DNA-binding MarR family transcriptional regulator